MGLTDYFTYDGEKSSDYGFYASGEGVFNSPEKDYEMVEIPGRNGDVAIDKHRFKNISVTYPCIIEMVGEDFKSAMSDFRNMLMSKSGYCRLEDTHNPDEYRLGVCRDIIEVNPTEYDLISNVNVVFDCKPQRFLKAGETEIVFPDGGESSPNLLVYPYQNTTKTVNGITFTDNGDGTITINGTATGTADFSLTDLLANSTLPTNGDVYRVTLMSNVASNATFWINGTIGNKNTNASKSFNTMVSSEDFYSGDYVIDTSAFPELDYVGRIYIRVPSGATLNNATIKPMLCLESDYDGKWCPYWNPTTQIYNPTAFEAKPIVMIGGYGDVKINDVIMRVYDSALGGIDMRSLITYRRASNTTYTLTAEQGVEVDPSFLLSGDEMTWIGGTYVFQFATRGKVLVDSTYGGFHGTVTQAGANIDNIWAGSYDDIHGNEYVSYSTNQYYVVVEVGRMTFNYGTASTVTDTASARVQYATSSTTYTTDFDIAMTLAYDGDKTFAMSMTASNTQDEAFDTVHYVIDLDEMFMHLPGFKGVSSLVPSELFVDTETGEAYFDVGDEEVSGNKYFYSPTGDLPVLNVGLNSVTYDNTITSVGIIPRWWRV